MPLLEVYRTEIKYEMPLQAYRRFEARISQMLAEDGFSNEQGGYRVRSLYLDTPYEETFYQSRDGQECRKKLRLRLYSPEDESVKLERKAKIGQNQVKTSLILTREQARFIAAGEYGFLLAAGDSFAQELFLELSQGPYLPRMMIEYNRIAYLAPANHIRITYDSNIGYTRSNLDLFSNDVSFAPLIRQGMGVLEVKYDNFLFSYIRDALIAIDRMPVAFGKYVNACEQI